MKIQNSNSRNKEKLLKELLKSNAFWSFDKNTINSKTISDNLLIESTFIHGDIDEIKLLFKIFSGKKLLSVWKERLVPDKRYDRLNYYLGVCFFHIPDTKAFIKKESNINRRYERLKQLTKSNESGIS